MKVITNRAILFNGSQCPPGTEITGYTEAILQAWLRANPPSVRVEGDDYQEPVPEARGKAVQATDVGAYGIPENGVADEDDKVGKPPPRSRRKK